MKRKYGPTCVLIWALVLTTGFAVAQNDGEQGSGADSNNTETVYTTEDLKKLDQDKSPAVYTNESLAEEPAEVTPAAAEAYSNKDLSERFGNERPPEAGQDTVATETVDEAPQVETEPEAEEPSMSSAERAEHITDIDTELERLEKRLLAIKNPLLAGTEKPTADENGLDNTERLKRTEEKIDELKKVLEELRDN